VGVEIEETFLHAVGSYCEVRHVGVSVSNHGWHICCVLCGESVNVEAGLM